MKIWVVIWQGDDSDTEPEITGAYRSRAAAIASVHSWVDASTTEIMCPGCPGP
jgi:hypothetical protein